MGINTAKKANFPSKLFMQNIVEVWNNGIEIEKHNFYKINKIANEYIDFARNNLVKKLLIKKLFI